MVLILMGSAASFGQTLRVTDLETGEPLAFVSLSSQELNVSVLTDEEGRAPAAAFRGATLIEARLLGYTPQRFSYFELEEMNFRIRLQSEGISLDQVVVSATRWSQSKRDVPARISTISAREVALQNPQTAADLLGSSGEVFVQKSQLGGGSPMIRGFSTNRLIYTVDGVRMNNAIFRGGNLQNVISLDPFAIANTEIVFGPGSIIYGSDAIGAVMSFQTLQPELSDGEYTLTTGKAVLRYASASNEQTAHFDVNLGGQKWAAVSSFSSHDFGDLRMGSDGPDDYLRPFYVQRQGDEDVLITNPDPLVQTPTGYSQINLMQKLRYQPHENWNIEYGFHYSTTSDYDRYDRHIRLRDGLPRSGEWRYGPQVWRMNNLSVTHESERSWYDQMTIRLAHQYFEESRIDRDFNDFFRSNRVEQVDAWSVNVDFAKQFSPRSRLFYGTEWVRNDVQSTGEQEDIRTGEMGPLASRYPQANWQSYAAYFTYQFNWTDQFLLQTGARYSQFALDADFSGNLEFFPFPETRASLNNGALNGSLGLVFRPNNNWVINGNLSTGFRAPNVDDIGKVFDSEPGAVVVPNPTLEAEYAYNAELGIGTLIGEQAKLEFSAYYTYLDNALVRRDFQLNGQDSIFYDGELSRVQAIQNAAKASVFGLQASAEVKLMPGWRFYTVFNYQVGEEELDDGTRSPSRHAPPWFGLSQLRYRANALTLELNAQYSGEARFEDLALSEIGKAFLYAQDENGNPYSPSWYTLNFKALYQLSEHFAISAGLENITDQRYRPYSSGLTAAGRNMIMALRMTF